MSDVTTDVIVATGGTAVVRAAYRSGNPAIGVGPGNVPVLVDATADLVRAARCIVDSKAFDNSILCTNESVLIAEERIADALERELVKQGAHVCSEAEAGRLRETVFPEGHWQLDLVGKDAQTIARAADIRVSPRTRVLVAPFALVVPEEPLAREKLFPVLGLLRVPDARRGIDAARAMVRIGGAGHSAVIHSADPRTIMAYGSAVNVLRVAVNAGGSTGSSGFETGLAPSMTIGTGFFGRSSLGGNLEPRHLVNWTQIAYVTDPAVPFGSFEGLEPWSAEPELVPRISPAHTNGQDDGMREEIRRLVVEELRELMRR
jgi:acyl-CoA reductase-like NAD-dependent aldehyde dehydrogenase